MKQSRVPPLAVQGIVLAGGMSTRMGRDKAQLSFLERPMIEIALEKLRSFCAAVAVSGNRSDLGHLATIIPETRLEAGPAAGLESGLRASELPWSMFLPVDVPLVPESLLYRWATAVLKGFEAGVRLSYLVVQGERQPAFCLLHRGCREPLERALERGERRLGTIFDQIAAELGPGSLVTPDAAAFAPEGVLGEFHLKTWFANVNTPEDLRALEAWMGEEKASK